MSSNGIDPADLVKKLAESYRGIKFGRGVVGKTSHATLGIIAAWGIILFRVSESLLLDSVLLASGLISTGVYCWWVHRTQKFAEANPGLALMEGAQLLEELVHGEDSTSPCLSGQAKRSVYFQGCSTDRGSLE